MLRATPGVARHHEHPFCKGNGFFFAKYRCSMRAVEWVDADGRQFRFNAVLQPLSLKRALKDRRAGRQRGRGKWGVQGHRALVILYQSKV